MAQTYSDKPTLAAWNAMAGNCVPMEKLTDITLTESQDSIEIDLTDNTWAEHMFVMIRYTPSPDNGIVTGVVRVNNDKTKGAHRNLTNASGSLASDLLPSATYEHFVILLYTGGGANVYPTGFAITPPQFFFCRTNLRLGDVQSLTIGPPSDAVAGEYPYKAGCRVEIWGIL